MSVGVGSGGSNVGIAGAEDEIGSGVDDGADVFTEVWPIVAPVYIMSSMKSKEKSIITHRLRRSQLQAQTKSKAPGAGVFQSAVD